MQELILNKIPENLNDIQSILVERVSSMNDTNISFLVDELKRFLEVELKWGRLRIQHFASIHDYPMYGMNYFNAINEIFTKQIGNEKIELGMMVDDNDEKTFILAILNS